MWRRSRRGYNTQKWHDAALEDGDNMINLNAKNRSSTRGGNLTWKVIQNISDPCTSHHTALSTTTGTKKKYIYINIIYTYIYVYIEEEMLFIGIQMEDQVWSPVHIYNVHIWIYILHVYTCINIYYTQTHTHTFWRWNFLCIMHHEHNWSMPYFEESNKHSWWDRFVSFSKWMLSHTHPLYACAWASSWILNASDEHIKYYLQRL